jgi:hypothetical protein
MIEFRFACLVAFWLGATASSVQCEVGSQWFGSDCWCKVSYYSTDGRAPCSRCENSYNWVVGSSTCTCNSGFVSTSSNSPCSKCGEFSDTSGSTGQHQCTCVVGSYGVSGRSPCFQCPPNSNSWARYAYGNDYYLSPAMNTCVCSPGFWNVKGGLPDDSDPCLPCPEYSTSQPGSRTCALCKMNAYREEPDAVCQACPEGTSAGRATTAVGMSTCAQCDIGYYSPSGSIPCMRCEEGFTTTGIGKTKCWPWNSIHTGIPSRRPTAEPTGPSAIPSALPTDAPTVLETSRPTTSKSPTAIPTVYPTRLPTAQFTARPTYSRECSPGFFSATGREPDCRPCPDGTTNDFYGQTSCPLCSGHHYSKDGRVPCKSCPPGQSSSSLWDHKYCVTCKGYSPGCAKPYHHHHHRQANGTTSYLRGPDDEDEE